MKDNNAEKLGKNAREYSIRKYSAEANAEIFRKACKAASEVEQHPICFRDEIGDEPFDMLCMQTGKERVLFQKSGRAPMFQKQKLRESLTFIGKQIRHPYISS